jgi:long-chain fatty acid transport protein
MERATRVGGRLAAAALVGLSGLLVASPAHASPLFELTGGIHGRGGFNARAVGAGSASTYFNPALLPKAKGGIDVSFMVVHDRIGIGLDPRPTGDASVDVPGEVGEVRLPSGDRPDVVAVPTDWLENGHQDFQARPRQAQRPPTSTTAYTAMGLTLPIFDEWLVFGFYGMVPMGDFARATSYFADEREQLFSNSLYAEMYEDRLRATSLAFALGSQLHETLSVGVAATLNLTNRATAPVFVPDPSNLGDILLLSDVDVRVGIAPHVGVSYEPHPDVRVTATAHSPSSFDIVAAYEFTLPNGQTQSSGVRFTHAYMPWKFGLGAAWDVLKSHRHDVTVATTLEYALWSNYRDRAPRRIDDGAPFEPRTPQDPYAWSDVFSGSLGVRYRYQGVHMFADATFQPTPVPAQTGRTNYVDNHRIGTMLGAEAEFELAGTPFRAGAHFQFHRLIPRSVTKNVPDTSGPIPDHQVQDAVPDDAEFRGLPFEGADGLQTNNPGFPGFSSGGWIIGAGVNLSVLF